MDDSLRRRGLALVTEVAQFLQRDLTDDERLTFWAGMQVGYCSWCGRALRVTGTEGQETFVDCTCTDSDLGFLGGEG